MPKPVVVPAADPEWFKKLPDDACVTAKELVPITGYKSDRSLFDASCKGCFPKPTLYGGFGAHRVRWNVKTVRVWLKERRAKNGTQA